MDTSLKLLGTLGLLAAFPMLFRMRALTRGTTLRAPWGWALAALTTWSALWLCDVLAATADAGLADRLWYLQAVLMLCPPIGALGSRRPMSRTWPWFVLLPLVIVLGLPVVVGWRDGWSPPRLRLEVPVLLGYLLVMVMGLGSYVGTRFTPVALGMAAALILLVAPLSVAAPAAMPAADRARLWSTLLLSGSALAAAWQRERREPAPDATRETFAPLDRLWSDFRDSFGIVWARRIQDRVNQYAEQESWPVRLGLQRLEWVREADATEATRAAGRIEQVFRWLLRRFADPEWIDERLR